MDDLLLSHFYNDNTLNIFCDASITGKSKHQTGCFGVAAVIKDEIIYTDYRLISNTTSNESELKGLRAALCLASYFKDCFEYINIFCDSQISIFGLRDYIYKWRYNPNTNMLYGSSGSPIINQNLFLECYYIMRDYGLFEKVRLFHQSGHVDNGYDKIKYAANVFRRSNRINGKIDLNLIRYISTYNNFVDHNSRSYLRKNHNTNMEYIDPIEFQYKEKIKRY